MEVLREHGQKLSGVGPDFSSTGERVDSTWQQLGGVYDAPEVSQLLAATGPVKTVAASVGEDVAAVGRALITYAATVKQIQERLDALRVQARNLVAEAQADKNSEGTLEKVGEFVGIGGDDDEYAERSNELTGQVNAQVAAFYEAQRVCANTINALYGGVQYRADDGDGQLGRGEFGYTREQLDAALEQGQELPWGTYAETDTGIVGGLWDGAKMFVGDLGALIGRDPVTGEWSWGTAGTAWQGLGTFVLAAGVYITPGGAVLDQTVGVPGFERGQLGGTLLAAGKGLIAYDEWGKGDNARAGGMAAFNVLSAVVGTKGAGAALRGVGAGAQASRIGMVSRAGTAMVRGGEFVGRLPTTESVVARVSQHLPDLRLPGRVPDVQVPHHVDTPHPHPDAPRADAPNPGSVGDRLADSGRAPDGSTPSTPDRPSTPDGSAPDRIPGDRAPDSTPPANHAPGDRAPGDHTPADRVPGDHVPGDRVPGDHVPGDHTPGDHVPADHTPGDHVPGDHTPGDHAPGDHTPDGRTPDGHTPGDGRPDYDGASEYRASDADRQAFRDSYRGYADDARFVEELQARDPAYRNVPTEDLAAIRGYTGDEFYGEMNRGMREADPDLLARYDPHIRTVTSGLNQLPKYEGVVGRGMTVSDPDVLRNLVSRYEPGQTVREPSFVSTDTKASFPGNVQFEIFSRSGRDVSDLSRYAGTESEVLFAPGSSFRVLERTFDPSTGTWYIRMAQN